MAIKAGQILHAMNRSVVDRIQTAGAGNLNIPTEKIRELGNYQTVATVRDVPDLSFNLDVLDVDTEVEALLTGSTDPYSDAFGDGATEATVYDLLRNVPADIVSPWKAGLKASDPFSIVRAVAIPFLTLEQASYRYGLRENAGETFTLRGDSIYYVPGSATVQVEAGDGATTAYDFALTGATPTPTDALRYVESGEDIYALSVSVNGERQIKGEDYSETASGIEFDIAPPADAVIKIVFGFDGEDNYPQSVHSGTAVKPAAIRGKDIDLYVAVVDTDATPVAGDFHRWSDVQAFNVDWRVTIEDDFEFGNPRAVERDYTDSPEVTGSVELRHRNPTNMWRKLVEITGVGDPDDANSWDQIIGPQSSQTVHLMLQLRNPEGHGTSQHDVGAVLKTLYVPDARFVLPGYEGRVQQKLNQTMNFDSDAGVLRIFKGAPTDAQFVSAAAAGAIAI